MIRLFRVLVPARILTLFLSEALLIAASYTAAAFLNSEDGWFFLSDQQGWISIAILECFLLFMLYLRQMYADLRVTSRIFLMQSLTLVMGSVFLAQALLTYLNLDWALPQRILIPGSIIAFVSVFGWRLLFSKAIRNQVGLSRLLFIGSSPIIAELADHLARHPELGYAPIGYLGREDRTVKTGPVYLGPFSQLRSILEESRPDRIVIGDRKEIGPREVDNLIEMTFGGVPTEAVGFFYEKTLGRVCAREIDPQQVIFSDNLRPDPLNVRLQSMYSVALVLLTLPLTLPLFVLIVFAILLSSRGPIMTRETRVGVRGTLFGAYRFRSCFQGEYPPRPTVIGKLLIRTGLDGLPQIWNVLRGQMSLIGPDADRPEFAARLNEIIPFHIQRLTIRPGITGWAQVHQDIEETRGDEIRRLEYDLYYAGNLSPLLDLFVILRWFRDALWFR